MASSTKLPAGHEGASVDVRGLSRSYQSVAALKSVDLKMAPGEFVALLGPSGCGKTTLLRCIAGLITPSSGDVLVDGRDITHLPVHRRGLGMVFQSYALFPHMTVEENVGFGLRMRGTSTADTRARVAEALGLVQMQGMGERYPSQLSGGQQQRIALARALVTDPKVLLLDEPFGALDAQLRETMQIELRRMQRRLGVTTVFVTHDQREAFTMADRVAVMSKGVLQQFGSPTAIYNRPATPFVAEFIGQVNRMSGRVLGRDAGGLAIEVSGRAAPIRAEAVDGSLKAGDAVSIMVRPERIQIAGAGPREGWNSQQGSVTEIVFSGEKVSLFVESAMGPMEVHEFSASTESGAGLSVGQAITLAWSPADTMVFPGAS